MRALNPDPESTGGAAIIRAKEFIKKEREKQIVKERWEKLQKREKRAREAAEKGMEAEKFVAKLVRESKEGPAVVSLKRAPWRVPDPEDYLDPKAVGDVVELLWLQGKEDEAREVLHLAIQNAKKGPPQDPKRHQEMYQKSLQLAAEQQLAADEKLARTIQLDRPVRDAKPVKRLTANKLYGPATDDYSEK